MDAGDHCHPVHLRVLRVADVRPDVPESAARMAGAHFLPRRRHALARLRRRDDSGQRRPRVPIHVHHAVLHVLLLRRAAALRRHVLLPHGDADRDVLHRHVRHRRTRLLDHPQPLRDAVLADAAVPAVHAAHLRAAVARGVRGEPARRGGDGGAGAARGGDAARDRALLPADGVAAAAGDAGAGAEQRVPEHGAGDGGGGGVHGVGGADERGDGGVAGGGDVRGDGAAGAAVRGGEGDDARRHVPRRRVPDRRGVPRHRERCLGRHQHGARSGDRRGWLIGH
mmetsp:Transcript_20667/g.64269  ORF Transcript_20667/g.64269 Transcript_20667/m.64269 type:complete len:282 (+) Transcript_20667:806-1651(+)